LAKKSAHCPFHDDQRNSFSIYKNGKSEWRFKCFAGCGEGDEITFLEKYYGISNREATKRFLEMAGVNGSARLATVGLKLNPKSAQPFDWRACVEAFTDKHIERLARWRGYSVEFCRWLKENGLVVTDGGSGPAGFLLDAVSANEGNPASDIVDWAVGTPDTGGLLRAERLGSGSGRTYTLTYRARDRAGNRATCNALVTVPHDHRK
jgi:hypothetical protein